MQPAYCNVCFILAVTKCWPAASCLSENLELVVS